MGSLNKVLIIGNLGQDPDVKFLPSGDAVVNLSVATTDRWKDKQTGEKRERVEWHRISFFGKRAEAIGQYFVKGDPIFVEGSLQTRKYEKDGVTHYATDIKGRDFQFLKSKGEGGESQPRAATTEGGSPQTTEPVRGPSQADIDDDIPF